MATLLQALRTHGPQLVYNRTATTAELAVWLAGRTGLTRGQVLLGLANVVRAVVDARRLETAPLGLRPNVGAPDAPAVGALGWLVGLRRRGLLVGSPIYLVAEGRHSAAPLAAQSREFHSPGVHGGKATSRPVGGLSGADRTVEPPF